MNHETLEAILEHAKVKYGFTSPIQMHLARAVLDLDARLAALERDSKPVPAAIVTDLDDRPDDGCCTVGTQEKVDRLNSESEHLKGE